MSGDNPVRDPDPEAQVGTAPVELDAANRPASQPAPALDQRSQSSQGESNFGDSSGRLFSLYSDAAEDEDNKMAKRWQEDAEGILIFTGLFSASVAALLSVTVQNLIPSSQDTSAFYLGNIYQVLADPNATHTPAPFPIAKSPQFSPPNYFIWVNSLWFLSLVSSITCALLATSSQQWARRYIKVTQPARCGPEKRARMRAFFAKGMVNMHIAQVVDGLPTLLHLSVFLFFAGLAILLVNLNITVFTSVAWFIGIFLVLYGLITVMPLIRHDSPYFSPLSLPAWFLYASISYLCLKVLFAFKAEKIDVYKNWQYWKGLRDRYRGWIFGGVEKAAEETVSERSSDIDADILRWTIGDLADDDRMEKFFEAIPDFFNSNLVKQLKGKLPNSLLKRFWKALDRFFDRTLSSNLVIDTVKFRLEIGMNAMSTITIPSTTPIPGATVTPNISSIPKDILSEPWDKESHWQNIDMGHAMTHWYASKNEHIALYTRCIATRVLASVQERNDRWYELATGVLGLSVDNLRTYIDHGNDSLSLAILMSVARRQIRSDIYDWGLLSTFCRLDIRNTLPELQHAFCKLWDDYVEEAQAVQTTRSQPADTLPIGILRLTRFLYFNLHRDTVDVPVPPPFSPSTPNFDRVLYKAESYPLCGIQSHRPHSTVFDSLADLLPTGRTLPTSPMSSSVPASTALIPNQQSGSHVLASTSTLQPHASPAFPSPPSHTPHLPNPDLLFALLSGTSLPGTSDSATQPRLRARGTTNQRNMYFTNAVLQLLVYCPPFWNLFSDLGRLTGRTGQRTSGGTTPLVDATVRLLDEFAYKKEGDETEPFTPTYVYDAMKEKRQFKSILGGQQWDAEGYLGVYLDALDEELLALRTSIPTHKPTSMALISPISRIFDGKFRMTSQGETVKVESWRTLQLDIQPNSVYTVQDALSLISQPRSVQVDPSDPSKESQQVSVLIEALPPVLIVHLKRFLRDTVAGGVVKNRKPVQFSPELEIPLNMMVPTAGLGRPGVPARYKLNGVLYHHGRSASGGHYSVDVLHPNAHEGGEGAWLRIEDDDVSMVGHKEVFERHENEGADDRCAYLLFYRRTASTQT